MLFIYKQKIFNYFIYYLILNHIFSKVYIKKNYIIIIIKFYIILLVIKSSNILLNLLIKLIYQFIFNNFIF